MERADFLACIEPSHALSHGEWLQLSALAERYPYCSLLRLRSFQGGRRFGTDQAVLSAERERVRLFLTDESILDKEWPMKQAAQPSADISNFDVCQKTDDVCVPEVEPEPTVDIFKEINSYQEVSFKTAPKSVILSSFLSSSVDDENNSPEDESLSVEELGKRSVVRDDDICTETLAAILEQQGKLDEARDMYGKLMLKYPEKSATFALRISQLSQSKK